MKNILSLSLSIALMGLTGEAIAQKKQKLFYSNGNLAFEGSYILTWSETEDFELINTFNPNDDISLKRKRSASRVGLYLYKDIIPTRAFDGLCKFYYNDGSLQAEGKYQNGVKNGDFKIYHNNGKLAARQSYINGMANGTWESWDEEGYLEMKGTYKPFNQEILDNILQISISEGISRSNYALREYTEKIAPNLEETGVFSYYRNPVLVCHQGQIRALKNYLEDARLNNKGFKDGTFTMWQKGELVWQMNFKENMPIGKWTLYSNGKPSFELSIEKDSVVYAKDFNKPENNYGTKEYIARKKKDDEQRANLANEENAISADLASFGSKAVSPPQKPEAPSENSNEIYRQVQEKASPSYSWSNYLKSNIKYPAEALKAKVEGRVHVEFVVEKDGSITNVKVLRGKELGHGLPEEAIRVVKAAPKWITGKQNGQAVRSYITIPIFFTIQ